ncbi:MAG: protein translocase subunit SecF [Pseudomonadota bacterium]
MFQRLIEGRKIQFMKYHWPAVIMSAVLIVAAIGVTATRGLNFGIDFVGGSEIEIVKPDGYDQQTVRDELNALGLGQIALNEARGTGVDAVEVVVIRIQSQTDVAPEDAEAAQQAATDAVENTLVARYPDLEIRSRSSVGPKVSGELMRQGVIALVVALSLMLVYIWFRFELQYSLGAVAALTHDVILTVGMFAALQLEFNLSTIAALLTIVGYSMNDTVVVFDRIREEKRKYKKLPDAEVIDIALNGTLSRTLLTSGTTLIALLAIFFLGGPVLRGMSFALIWGVVIGTYSSIFVASTLLLFVGLRGDTAPKEVQGFQGAP